GIELAVDLTERLEPRAELGPSAPDTLRDGAHSAVSAGEQGDDAVGLTELLGAQHDTLVPVELHLPIVAPRMTELRDAARAAPVRWLHGFYETLAGGRRRRRELAAAGGQRGAALRRHVGPSRASAADLARVRHVSPRLRL